MTATHLSPAYAVREQLTPDEVADLAARGFTDIVCNRPDAEIPGGPTSGRIAAAAAAAGLRFHYLPVAPGAMPIEHADDLAAVLARPGTRVLAYCRSGARSTLLWNLAAARHLPAAS
jgi:sulfide:quinone oxidoreductase